jgi:peptide/nickel transport system ATP-binding protein
VNDRIPAPQKLLEVTDLGKTYARGGHGGGPLRALHGVSFQLDSGEALAIVGESGSGKSTIARLLLRLEGPDKGRIALNGEALPRGRAPLSFRARVQLVFQDPFGSLNPRDTVYEHLARPLLIHRRATLESLREAATKLLSEVGLEPAADYLDKLPHALSGGQRQRVAIARALAPGPALLVADEPTSMLDVSLRMGILNLLAACKRAGLGLILITHDLASARYLADRVLVLYAGELVELAPTETLLERPRHPYTRLLLEAATRGGRPLDTPLASAPTAPMSAAPSTGCAFAPRCPRAEPRCGTLPPLVRLSAQHHVRCHLATAQEPPP